MDQVVSMVLDNHCPGSRSIRSPVPENIPCPQCGREVEIWTDETKAVCPGCKTVVFRERKILCIDWCPYAKECVGPEVYERLKPAEKKDSTAGTPLELLKKEHDRVLDTIALLRGVNLCLKFSSLGTGSPLQDRGLNHLRKIIEFFDKDVTLHFRREEEVLFPALEKHIAAGKSPARMLLHEHDDWRGYYRRLKEIATRMEADGATNTEALSCCGSTSKKKTSRCSPWHAVCSATPSSRKFPRSGVPWKISRLRLDSIYGKDYTKFSRF